MVVASHLCYEIEKNLSSWFCKCMCGYVLCVVIQYYRWLYVVIDGYRWLYVVIC